jgi:hypothetical protein
MSNKNNITQHSALPRVVRILDRAPARRRFPPEVSSPRHPLLAAPRPGARLACQTASSHCLPRGKRRAERTRERDGRGVESARAMRRRGWGTLHIDANRTSSSAPSTAFETRERLGHGFPEVLYLPRSRVHAGVENRWVTFPGEKVEGRRSFPSVTSLTPVRLARQDGWRRLEAAVRERRRRRMASEEEEL